LTCFTTFLLPRTGISPQLLSLASEILSILQGTS
jgi:hypothetical protein